ncbi:RagB/SusD family nutrient uptake outer membrane protein [Prolixibacteraceae bacterium JC049]|nr:RagB/SusD family nutrient uptake outer membrane protein [Prolixibacteraceae bacterium JC049]
MKTLKYIAHKWQALLLMLVFTTGCETSYLDVVPDNLATVEDAFSMRTNAEKYLFTCYSYMPSHGSIESDPGMLGGDEFWGFISGVAPGASSAFFKHDMFNLSLGHQNKINPYGNSFWDDMFKAIRDCNIFLDNINKVPDIDELEKREWIGEVKFLKAYYHFYLIKLYGPIPLIKESLPIDATIDEVRVARQPIDECFNYVISLLDEAAEFLPAEITDPFNELGRITKPIALSVKAKVMLFRASPLFNGNNDFEALHNNDGTKLFNTSYDENKWAEAASACKAAIEASESIGVQLYRFNSLQQLSDATVVQMGIRNAVCEKWNSEIIWANSQSWSSKVQQNVSAHVDETNTENTTIRTELCTPLRMLNIFYTKNGVPIEEDKSWNYNDRYGVRTAEEVDFPNIKKGYKTTKIHFDRENRYYANIGFDGGYWYGQGKYNEDDLFYIRTKFKQPNGNRPTGSFVKKLVHWENVQTAPKGYSINSYPWPVIRLSDLYLMYAEALNESAGPSEEVKNYIDKVRERAGLKGVDEAWANYSNNPTKPDSKEGLREIIQQERMIELAYEGKRYFDLRRWKIAPNILNSDVLGFDVHQTTSEMFSDPKVLFTKRFRQRDYFFPIKDSYIIRNRNLVQNLGW